MRDRVTTQEMIRHIQKHAGFNDKELGDFFGVSRRSIQNWASGSAISESNAANVGIFYTKLLSLDGLAPKAARAALLSRAEGESFIEAFKGSTKRAQTMRVATPIEARFV